MSEQVFAAVDLGASSGRVMAVGYDGSKLALEELHRFPNAAVERGGSFRWDLPRLQSEVLNGLAAAAERYGQEIVSVGVDTWGVDYGLFSDGELMESPYCYRDPRTKGMLEKAFQLADREEIFYNTGLQFMELNTLFQLLSVQLKDPAVLEWADKLLFIPDIIHQMLSGTWCNEFTIASTSQLLDPRSCGWARGLLDKLGIPDHFLHEIVQPGTCVGHLREVVAGKTGLSRVKVVLPPSHDTASAVLSVPFEGDGRSSCYLSLGTWALMGLEVPEPVVTDEVLSLNFTNEGGVDGTTRLLKNITGLWVLQECRRAWGGQLDWRAIDRAAMAAAPFRSFIDPDAPDFGGAGQNMPEVIQHFCARTAQPVPETLSDISRCVMQSLCMKIRHVFGACEKLAGRQLETIHVVGGGATAALICQWIANACNRRVLAGPIEATALGNGLMQAISADVFSSVGEARAALRASFPPVEYTPENAGAWAEQSERFASVIGR